MAGGNKRGAWGPLTDRAVTSHSAPPFIPAPPPPPTLKHCWVSDRHGRLPGLLLEWGRRGQEWHGRVLRPVPKNGNWEVVEEWLPAGLLDPA